MTNQQIEKIRYCLVTILWQGEFISCHGSLSEQRKERLEEVKSQVIQIDDILKE